MNVNAKWTATPRADNNAPAKPTPTGGHHGAETNSITTPSPGTT